MKKEARKKQKQINSQQTQENGLLAQHVAPELNFELSMVVCGCIQGFASANINTLLKLLRSLKLLKILAWVQTHLKVNKL